MCWNLNGTWLASCSRDLTVKVWDVRHTKRELSSWQGHGRDVSAVAWHPIHLDLLASGRAEGWAATHKQWAADAWCTQRWACAVAELLLGMVQTNRVQFLSPAVEAVEAAVLAAVAVCSGGCVHRRLHTQHDPPAVAHPPPGCQGSWRRPRSMMRPCCCGWCLFACTCMLLLQQ